MLTLMKTKINCDSVVVKIFCFFAILINQGQNRVSPYFKRQFIFFTFLVYLVFLYIVYLAYNGTLVHRVKINMAPFQLFGNVHGAQQATHYSEIYTKICGLEKPVDLDGLSALHWVQFIYFFISFDKFEICGLFISQESVHKSGDASAVVFYF